MVIAVFIAAAAAVAIAGGAPDAAPSAAAKPKWLTISGFWDGVTGPEVAQRSLRSGLDRALINSQSRSLLGSLGRVRGRLSFAKAAVAAQRPRASTAGPRAAYHLPGWSPGSQASSGLRLLLANGKVGATRAVPDDPEKIPPAGARSGGRRRDRDRRSDGVAARWREAERQRCPRSSRTCGPAAQAAASSAT